MATFLTGAIVRQDHGQNTTRRNLFRGGAALAAIGTVAAIPALAARSEDDAELASLASHYAIINAEIRRLEAADDTPDETFVPWDHSRHEVSVRAANLMAGTAIGLRAKAEIIIADLDLLGLDSLEGGVLGDLATSLAHDVVRLVARA
jgi:hypothetical protein